MKLTKFGHSCILIEDKGSRVLFDPGEYSTSQNAVSNLDAVLITHSHSDHLDRSSLDLIMKNNPSAVIITNNEVAGKLSDSKYNIQIIEDGKSTLIKDLKIEGLGNTHGAIYPGVQTPPNTGYFIGDRIFNTRDSLILPNRNIEILMCPMIAPWLNIGQMLDYVKSVHPKCYVPLHQAILKDPDMLDGPINKLLSESGIKYLPLELDEEYEL